MGMEINPLHVANLPHLDPGPLVQALASMEAVWRWRLAETMGLWMWSAAWASPLVGLTRA